MFRLLCLWLVCLLACIGLAQGSEIKPGDLLTVSTAGQPQYSGDFFVSSEGTITVQVFGTFTVGGKRLNQIQREIQAKAREYVRDANVTVILKTELPLFVYIISEKVRDGVVPWTPGLDLRQLVAKHPDLMPLDTYVAKLYHKDGTSRDVNLVELVRKSNEKENVKVQPGDVLTLLPSASKTVWVVGAVLRPGQVRVGENDGPAQAIALAGGQTPVTFTNSQMTVTLRRGDSVQTASLAEVLTSTSWSLEAGDTLILEPPRMIEVHVGGSVTNPGVVKVRENGSLISAVESAGGLKSTGTLDKAIVFRKNESIVVDARSLAQGGNDQGIQLQDGDFVYVRENRREYHVLGYVAKPGAKLIPDSHEIRLADALAASEGLRVNGTYRRVVVMRASEDGKHVAKRYDLDKYIKDGDKSQNPVISAGDIVFFDQASGTSLNEILRIVPSLLLLDRFF